MDLATKKEETPLGAILELSIRIRYLLISRNKL